MSISKRDVLYRNFDGICLSTNLVAQRTVQASQNVKFCVKFCMNTNPSPEGGKGRTRKRKVGNGHESLIFYEINEIYFFKVELECNKRVELDCDVIRRQ